MNVWKELERGEYRVTLSEPWFTPTVIHSDDGCMTWSEPTEVCSFRGRIYDALCRDDVIYALEFCNDAEIAFTGNKPEPAIWKRASAIRRRR